MVVYIATDSTGNDRGSCMTGKDSNASNSSTPVPARTTGNGAADNKSILSEHKGKLAIGVAATLGIMIFYNWRQKNLPKEDPEGYARLQRLKESLKADDASHRNNDKHRKPTVGK